jgi:hypothetical protein
VPHQTLRPGVVLAQTTRRLNGGHGLENSGLIVHSQALHFRGPCSPSPYPSPLGRGKHHWRRPMNSGRSYYSEAGENNSLSRRERVRVRGNSAINNPCISNPATNSHSLLNRRLPHAQ